MKHLSQPSSAETNDEKSPTQYVRRILWLAIALCTMGALIYGIHDYLKAKEHAKVTAARTEMIKAQAQANNLTLLSEERIKELTAINTGVPLKDLTFKEISLITFDDLPAPQQLRKIHHPMVENQPSRNAPENVGIPDEENIATLPPLKVPVNNDNTHKVPSSAKPPLVEPVSSKHPDKQPNPATKSTRAVPADDFNRTPPQELQRHPFYQIITTCSGLTYELIIDGINGHIIKSIVH